MLTPYDTGLGIMYRYGWIKWSLGVDDWDNPLAGHRLEVTLEEYAITKRTEKGVWIDYWGKKRFILNDSRKRFACENKELAKESFRRRKLRQRSILQKQLADVGLALELIDAKVHDSILTA